MNFAENWEDKVDFVDEVDAETINRIAHEIIRISNELENEQGEIISKSPYIGSNGNWFEWDTENQSYVDTGVKAQGLQGPDGPQGPQGEQGDKGDAYVLTDTDKNDIADLVLEKIPISFGDVIEYPIDEVV